MIEGTAIFVAGNEVTVDVQGVGYFVHTISSCTPNAGQSVRFFTYLAVRETALDLYGFLDQRSLGLFELLLSIPKIGPKSALQILEQASPDLLQEAVALEDPVHLSKLSGIGKKTAENIVRGLKGKLELPETSAEAGTISRINNDAFDALIALGYTPQSVRDALQSVDPTADTQTQIKEGLRNL